MTKKSIKIKGRAYKEKLMEKGNSALKLTKYENNPIIVANPENDWEAWQTFNPGVIVLNDNIHFLYRAIGQDGISRLGYAISSDGFTITERFYYPVYQHPLERKIFHGFSYSSGGSFGGTEDPRLTRVDEEDVLYMTYTACDGGLRVALTSIKVEDFLKRNWKWTKPVLISSPGQTHKNWVIFPEKINGRYAILHSIKPKIQIEYVDNLVFDNNHYINSCYAGGQQEDCWDTYLRGAAAPPLKMKDGWLLIYHAIEKDCSKYKVGAMLLDLNDPTKVLYRAQEPILEPSEPYEHNGYKGGITYVTGAIIKGDALFVYYGAADSYVGVASAPLYEFLNTLKSNKKPKLSEEKTIKKKK